MAFGQADWKASTLCRNESERGYLGGPLPTHRRYLFSTWKNGMQFWPATIGVLAGVEHFSTSSTFDSSSKNTSSTFDSASNNTSSTFDRASKNTSSTFESASKYTSSTFDSASKNSSNTIVLAIVRPRIVPMVLSNLAIVLRILDCFEYCSTSNIVVIRILQ